MSRAQQSSAELSKALELSVIKIKHVIYAN